MQKHLPFSNVRLSLASVAWFAALLALVCLGPPRGFAQGGDSKVPAERAGGGDSAEARDGSGASKATGKSVARPSDIEEIAPAIYYLPDDQGKLRAAYLDGITFEQFKKRLSELASQTADAPRYVLNSLTMDGQVRGARAELTIRLTIECQRGSDKTWVRVPLKMGAAILLVQDAVHYKGAGELFLQYDESSGGFVAWLRGGSDKPHQLTLKTLVPIQQLGSEYRLRLNLPRATTSELQLTVPGKQVTATVAAGGEVQQETVGGASHLTILAPAGDLRLAWRPSNGRDRPRKQALEVEGLQRIQIQGGQVRTQVDLTVRSFGGPIDHLRVQLPKNARLISEGQPGYTVSAEELPKNIAKSTKPAWVDVKLDRPAKGPVHVRLVTQQLRDGGRRDQVIQLAGFHVADAVLESGYIVVQVRGDWTVRWDESMIGRLDIGRVDTWPDPLPTDNVAAGFEYYRQPYSLKARVEPPTTRVEVEPTYRMEISDDEALLSARLWVQVHGAPIDQLVVDLGDWQWDEAAVGPDTLVEIEHAALGVEGTLTIPLTRAAKGEFEITFRARKPLVAVGSVLDLSLPKPRVDALGSTSIVILPDDDIGLVAQNFQPMPQGTVPAALLVGLPERQQPPLVCVLERGAEVPDQLRASRSVHPLSIRSEVLSRIHVSKYRIRIEQRLAFEVAHARVESLVLNVPQSLADGDLEIVRDGERVAAQRIAVEPGSGLVSMRVPLSNTIGRIDLTVRYVLPPERLRRGVKNLVAVPLVMPGHGPPDRNRIEMEVKDGVLVELAESEVTPWTPTSTADPALPQALLEEVSSGMAFQSEVATRDVSILVSLAERTLKDAVVVRRCWLRTTQTPDGRIDRAVFRLQSPNDALVVLLPEGAKGADTEIILDGRGVAPDVTSEGHLRIELPRVRGDQEDHSLTLRYYVARHGRAWGRLHVQVPTFSSGAYLQEPFLWQLVLPAQEHLVDPPSRFVPCYTWQWRRLGWRRENLVSSAELQQWTADPNRPGDSSPGLIDLIATDGLTLPRSNIYLFSSVSLPQKFNVAVAPRYLLVLMAGGAVLLVGMGLLYLPGLRRRGYLFVAAVVLMGLGMVYPEATLLLAQLATVGVVLTLLALLLYRLLNSHRAGRSAGESSGGSSIQYHAPSYGAPGSVPSSRLSTTVAGPQVFQGPATETDS